MSPGPLRSGNGKRNGLADGGGAVGSLHAVNAAASAVIGGILIYVAYELSKSARALIIGEAAPPEQHEAIRATLAAEADVEKVLKVLAVQIGTKQLLVVARERAVPPEAIEGGAGQPASADPRRTAGAPSPDARAAERRPPRQRGARRRDARNPGIDRTTR